ncbi:MAG: glycosyltransferase [Candidatus Thermoplasmatota archaeon]|nr:glycosyltransferase [Candidatus Thermoplasmatota archaeon]
MGPMNGPSAATGPERSSGEDPELLSVVVTVKNEIKNIKHLLDSIVIQDGPLEVLVVDAASTDGTFEVLKEYERKWPFIRPLRYAAQRGESRNMGIKEAKGSIIAFIDGDCIANPFWAREIRKALSVADIVGGTTIPMGYEAFQSLGRVEVFYKGVDITWPSCNLAYRKKVLDRIGGFDPQFITAEDIDLNFRAVNAGYFIGFESDMVVYHKERSTILAFFKQAFWNGFGRKQLTMKHGSLWGSYDPRKMLERPIGVWWLIRTSIAFLGYFSYHMAHPRYKVTRARIKRSPSST